MPSAFVSLAGLDREAQIDLVWAAIELGLARLRLKSRGVRSLAAGTGPVMGKLDRRQELFVGRVAFAIPRVAVRVPWRADCLVQAMAAKRWLARRDISSELVLGARTANSLHLEAHAWLRVGETIVTGGDITSYSPFSEMAPLS